MRILSGDGLDHFTVEVLFLQHDGEKQDLLHGGIPGKIQPLLGQAVLHINLFDISNEFFFQGRREIQPLVKILLGQPFMYPCSLR